MTEENKITCPYCGETNNIKQINKVVCFDEIIYTHQCNNCGHKFDSVTL